MARFVKSKSSETWRRLLMNRIEKAQSLVNVLFRDQPAILDSINAVYSMAVQQDVAEYVKVACLLYPVIDHCGANYSQLMRDYDHRTVNIIREISRNTITEKLKAITDNNEHEIFYQYLSSVRIYSLDTRLVKMYTLVYAISKVDVFDKEQSIKVLTDLEQVIDALTAYGSIHFYKLTEIGDDLKNMINSKLKIMGMVK